VKELRFLAALNVAGIDKIQLLEQISRLGSISKAAKVIGISYRTAWESLQVMNSSEFGPLVRTVSGGSKGGGAELTPTGKKILVNYQLVAHEHKQFIQKINGLFIRRATMKTSARNQFFGTVIKVKKGAINSEVEVLLNGGDIIISTITNESIKTLNIKKNSEVWAIFKASWVILGLNEKVTLSARNQLAGAVSKVQKGAVNSEVSLNLKGGNEVVAVITNESLKKLKIKKGTKAIAYIKASHIILGINT
jgi:molybdate transport system regulatory protein